MRASRKDREGAAPRYRGSAAAALTAFALGALTGTTVPAAAGEILSDALPGAPVHPPALRASLARRLVELGPGYLPRTRNLRADGSPRFSNRLLLESSPYLQQHAHNPVNWYPWGDAAFAAARELGRPVLVSIGYSTCHWCHVMEEESFDDPEIARYLNAHFIAIKVDREARPDVDAVYMAAVHALGARGGWPLNVWVTPDRQPFYGGTYFPPRDRGGRPGFPSLLRTLHAEYSADPEAVRNKAARIAAKLRKQLEGNRADASQIPDAGVFRRARASYARGFDREWGGIGRGTKFPSQLPIRLLLRDHRRSGEADSLAMATLTLEKMAQGGMYDQIGGGFHRYSTGRRWLVPHFEKMLYDNALLVLAYLEGWLVTGREDFARISHDTLRYVGREMTSPHGGFYSATDADSPGPDGESEEGWFFTWTPAELREVLGADTAQTVSRYFGVTPRGNHEGRNILQRWTAAGPVARSAGVSSAQLLEIVAKARAQLYAARATRPPPLRDEKILVAWNGLMISAFARAGFAFAEPAYTERARKAARFVLDRMRVDGRLVRVYKDGSADGPAFLEDYAFLVAGLLDLYEADPDPAWLREAIALQTLLDAHYADREGGGYFKTSNDHEALLAREKPARDGAIPSGNSVAALNLLRLAEFTGNPDYLELAGRVFSAFYARITARPTALSEMLIALDYYLDTPKEIVIVRPASGADAEALLAVVRLAYLPNRVLSVVTEGSDREAHARLVPLVAGKKALHGRPTAYVCEDRVCELPTSDPALLAKQLRRVKPPR